MTFDVVIPSKNRQEDLYRMLDSIYKSSVWPESIIIVDQSDNLYDISEFENKGIKIVHIYDPAISGASVARNVGIDSTAAEIIYIFDDDIVLENDFFEIINHHFVDFPAVAGICGRQKNSKSGWFKILSFSLFHRGEFKDDRKKYNSGLVEPGIYPVTKLSGGIVAYRREVFKEFKFDDIYIRGSLGEDRDFSYRVSKQYPLMFATDALALHNHSQIGRYNAEEDYACKIASYTLFYIKNIDKTLRNNLCFKLVIIGVWTDALAYALKHRSFLSFKGIKKGYKYIKEDFVGVPFVDSKKYKDRYVMK